MRHAHSLGSKSPVFYKLFDVLLNEMKNSDPEIDSGKEVLGETLNVSSILTWNKYSHYRQEPTISHP